MLQKSHGRGVDFSPRDGGPVLPYLVMFGGCPARGLKSTLRGSFEVVTLLFPVKLELTKVGKYGGIGPNSHLEVRFVLIFFLPGYRKVRP